MTAEAWSAISHAGVRAEPRTEPANISTTAVEPRTLIFLLLFQEKSADRKRRGASWGNPLSRVFCQSSLASSLEQPRPGIGQLHGERGSLVGRGPWSPQRAAHWEPGTNLSPVTGSVLLRVSRSMMESNGTFRKNTLRGRSSTTVSRREPQAGLVRDQGGHQPPRAAGASVAITQGSGYQALDGHQGKMQAGPPCRGSSPHPDSGTAPSAHHSRGWGGASLR